jgi:hypothetical protein
MQMEGGTIGVRISAGFAVILTISVSLGIFATNRTAEISRKTDALTSNYFPSILALSDLQANLEHTVSLVGKTKRRGLLEFLACMVADP